MLRRWVVTLGLLLWCGVVLAAYYAVHKPWPADLGNAAAVWGMLRAGVSPPAVVTLVTDVGTVLWVLAVACGCGSTALRRCGVRSTGAERLLFGTALGMGAIALASWLLAMLQFLTPPWVLLTMGGLTAVAVRELAATDVRAVADTVRSALGGPQPWPVRTLQAGLAVAVAVQVTQALAPPTGWDALVYHLTGPAYYLRTGGYVPGLDLPHSYFPSVVEGLFTVALAAGSDRSPGLLHLGVAALGVAAVFAYLRARLGSGPAWFGVAVLLSVASLGTLAAKAYVDWGLLSFGFLAFWALELAWERGGRGWLVVSALLAGMTLGAKYTGLCPVVGLGLLLAWRVVRGRASLAALLGWGAAAALAFTPWLARNLLLTGNPVYPFVFDGRFWDPWKTAWITRPGTGLVAEPLRVVAAPWEVTVIGREGGLYDASLGPLLLALLPLAVWAGVRGGWAGRVLAVAGVAYAGWLAGAAQTSLLMQGRLLLPAAPFLAAAAVAGWARLPGIDLPQVRISRLVGMVTGLVAGLGVASLALGWLANPPLPVLLGAEPPTRYQERRLGEYAGAVQGLGTLPAGAKVLFLWEPRTYLCPAAVTCQADAFLYNWRYLLHRVGDDAPAAAADLRAAGYTHLLVYGGGLRFFTEPPNVEAEAPHVQALLDLLARDATLVRGNPLAATLALPPAQAAGRGYALYAIHGTVR